MTLLARARFELTGWEGAPGVNVLIFSGGSTTDWTENVIDGLALELYGIAVATYQPNCIGGLVWRLDPTFDIFDSATGEIQGVVTTTEDIPSITCSSNAKSVSRATMMNVRYLTDQWINGRRLQGRSYIGPIASTTMDSQGHITQAIRDDVEDSYYASITGLGTRLAVWHRPRTKGAADGSYGDVVRVQVAEKPASLRSRRD